MDPNRKRLGTGSRETSGSLNAILDTMNPETVFTENPAAKKPAPKKKKKKKVASKPSGPTRAAAKHTSAKHASPNVASLSVPVSSTTGQSSLAQVLQGEHQHSPIQLVYFPVSTPDGVSRSSTSLWSLEMKGKVRRWDVTTRELLGSFTLDSTPVLSMFSHSNNMWFATSQGVQRRDHFGELLSRNEVATYAFCIAEDDCVIWAGSDGFIVRYDQHGTELSRINVGVPNCPILNLCSVYPDTGVLEVVALNANGQLFVVNMEFSVEEFSKANLPSKVESMVWKGPNSPNSIWLGCHDGAVVQLDIPSRTMKLMFKAHKGKVMSMCVFGDFLWTGGWDKEIHCYDHRGELVDSMKDVHTDGILDLERVPDGSGKEYCWASSGDRSVSVWDPSGNSTATSPRTSLKAANRRDLSVLDQALEEFQSHKETGAPEEAQQAEAAPDKPVLKAARSASTGSRSSSGVARRRKRSGKKTSVSDLQAMEDDESVSEDVGPEDETSKPVDAPAAKTSADAPSTKSKRTEGPFHAAAATGNATLLRKMCSESDTPRELANKRTTRRRTPLHSAALGGHLEAARVLLELGAVLGSTDKYGLTAAHVAKTQELKEYLLGEMLEKAIEYDASKAVPAAALVVGRPKQKKRKKKKKGRSKKAPKAAVPPKISVEGSAASSEGNVDDLVDNLFEDIDEEELEGVAVPKFDLEYGAELEKAATLIQAFWRRKVAGASLKVRIKKRAKRQNIAKEMLQTEDRYVNGLDMIWNQLHKTMCTKAFQHQAGTTENDIKTIFPQSLQMLLTSHQMWVEQLRQRIDTWNPTTCVGDLFLQLSPYLKIYIVYVSTFEQAVIKIRELKKKQGSRFKEVTRDIFTRLGDPSNDLATLLVTPVQRIPRYVMLLADLLKNTDEEHPDFAALQKACEVMTDTTIMVDQKAEDAKNSLKVLEVSEGIRNSPTPIVQPNRKWVRDGSTGLRDLVDLDQSQERYLFLFTDLLLLCKKCEEVEKVARRGMFSSNREDKKAKKPVAPRYYYQYVAEMKLGEATVRSLADSEHFEATFLVKSPKIAFLLTAPSERDKRSWMQSIETVSENLKQVNDDLTSARTLRHHKPTPAVAAVRARSAQNSSAVDAYVKQLSKKSSNSEDTESSAQADVGSADVGSESRDSDLGSNN